MFWAWSWYLVLLVLMIAGLALTLMSLPGLWLMWGSAVVYGWLTDWQYLGWKGVLVLLALCLLAELAEFAMGGAVAKRAGGSKRAAFGAIIGALVGAFFLTFGIPFVGTVIGAVAGAFLGALTMELTVGGDIAQSATVGIAAGWGRFLGIVFKLGFGCIVLVLGMILAFPWGVKPPAVGGALTPGSGPAPSTLPAGAAASQPVR